MHFVFTRNHWCGLQWLPWGVNANKFINISLESISSCMLGNVGVMWSLVTDHNTVFHCVNIYGDVGMMLIEMVMMVT